MPIQLIDKIKPKNGGSFAMVDAADVEVDSTGKRLDDELTGIAEDIAGKQDTILDLSAIRIGAEAGATALQPEDRPPIMFVDKMPENPVDGIIYMVVEAQ